MARTTRTLGALVASGVPIIEGLTITRETSGNAMYEKIYSKVNDSIRDGDTIANPMKKYAVPGFHPVTAFFFMTTMSLPPLAVLFIQFDLWFYVGYGCGALCTIALMFYFLVYKKPVVEDLVVNINQCVLEGTRCDLVFKNLETSQNWQPRVLKNRKLTRKRYHFLSTGTAQCE